MADGRWKAPPATATRPWSSGVRTCQAGFSVRTVDAVITFSVGLAPVRPASPRYCGQSVRTRKLALALRVPETAETVCRPGRADFGMLIRAVKLPVAPALAVPTEVLSTSRSTAWPAPKWAPFAVSAVPGGPDATDSASVGVAAGSTALATPEPSPATRTVPAATSAHRGAATPAASRR